MKKIAIILAAAAMLLAGTNANAQLQVGAGYLNSTQTITNSESVNTNGFYAGLSYNIPLVAGLGVVPGLYYSMLGGKSANGLNLGFIALNRESKFTEHAINVPVYLNYGFPLMDDFKFLVFAGPTVQYGLSSKSKTTGSVTGALDGGTQNTVDNYADGKYNRLNVYVGGGLAMNAGRMQVSVGFDYGLMDLLPKDENVKSNRYNIKIGVAYLF